jgi:hypothetical protein
MQKNISIRVEDVFFMLENLRESWVKSNVQSLRLQIIGACDTFYLRSHSFFKQRIERTSSIPSQA